MSSVRRQFSNDSRSPTLEQIPSCNVPMRSREGHGGNTLPHLLDGFRLQIQEDRQEQDKFMRTLETMFTKIKQMRDRQDDCLNEIRKAMRRVDPDREEELDDFQGSQTQAWPVGRPYRTYRASSDEGDSVLGPMRDGTYGPPTQPELRTGRIGVSTVTRPGQPDRGSTELEMNGFLDVRDAIPIDVDDSGLSTVGEAQEVTQTVTAPESRLPTPITPGTQPRKPRGRPPTSNPKQRRGPTGITKARRVAPSAPAASSSKQSKITSMRPPATPASKGKRKRPVEDLETPTSTTRPVRRAGQAAMERTGALLEFAQRSARAQSKARNAGEYDPFVWCGDCRKPGCKRCDERADRELY